MPTTRPRHFVTESDELGAALDAAAVRHPGLTRPQLLVMLALEGDAAASAASMREVARRRRLIERNAGALTGVYSPDYLAELRKDWPE